MSAVDTGSLAAAAQVMGYSVSSVSRMVADIEAQCGFSLLMRAKSGVTPTDDGLRMLECARRIVNECDCFDELAVQVSGGEVGTVRIGTFSSVATHWLPHILSRFRADHPNIECELLSGDYTEIEQWLLEGRVHLGFVREPTHEQFATHMVVQDDLVAVIPQNHRLAKRKKFPVAAFADEPFIALVRERDREGMQLLEKHGIVVRPVFSTWDDYAIMAMVEAGMGIALLPSLILQRCSYHIVALPLDVPARRDIMVAWNPRSNLSPAAQSLLGMIVRCAS